MRVAKINQRMVEAPEGAVAWKYNDPTEPARWVYDVEEAKDIEGEDNTLIVWVDAKELERMVMLNGIAVDFDAAVMLMDDDIRERLHLEMAPCTDQEFMDAYAAAHEDEFGETFAVN